MTTVVTSAPSGNDHNDSFSDQSSYTIFDLKDFAETLALTIPSMGPSQEEATISSMSSLAGLDVLYHNIIQRWPLSTADSMTIVKRSLFLPPCW